MRESYRDVTLSFFVGVCIYVVMVGRVIVDMVGCFYVVCDWLLTELTVIVDRLLFTVYLFSL